MAEQIVYRSPNGDDWSFEPDGAGGGSVVHRANPASGGAMTRQPVAEFLERAGGGPEAQAVREALAKAQEK